MRRRMSASLALLLLVFFSAVTVLADGNTTTFESFTLGPVNGQGGWVSLGAIGSGCAVYDHQVASVSGLTTFGAQSLRISNAVTSGCFGDQTFAKPLVDAVGEANSTNGTFSPGTLQHVFTVDFDIASAVPTAQQPGLAVSVSPDRGDGSRMSYLRFDDIASGIQVSFDDVQGTGTSANFVETSLQVLDRTRPHHITLQLAAVDGPSNDIVKVWIDGALKITGTSWENYYRYDTEASAEQSPRIVKTVIFRTGGVAAPANLGKGFLFDNVNLSSGPGATYSCAGFESPMDKTVSVGKANRVLPLKMVCTDSTGRVLGPTDIAAPVVQVTKNPTESPTVLTDVDLSAGQGTDGNQFVFDSTSSRWIFNLQTKNFTGSGTYAITAVPGLFDVIDTHPTGTFIVK